MKLPNHEQATIPQKKMQAYLLSSTHRAGKSKAAFFTAHGFEATHWTHLAEALRHHAGAHPVTTHEATPFGTRYIIEGVLEAPNGRHLSVRSIWFIDDGKESPRFVTAYPLPQKGRRA